MRTSVFKTAIGAAAVLAMIVPAQAASAATGTPERGTRVATAPLADAVFCSYMVTADWLRYRTGPGTNYPAVGQYPYGTVLSAYRDDVRNGFRHLANGYWASSQYLRRTGANCYQ
jgi:hypothetical protein